MTTTEAFNAWFTPTYGRDYGAPIIETDPVFVVAARYLAVGYTAAVGKPSPEAAAEADRLAEEQAKRSIGMGAHDMYEPYLYPVQFLGCLVEAEWAAGGHVDVAEPVAAKPDVARALALVGELTAELRKMGGL